MNAPQDFNAIKSRQQTAWASGDYSLIGTTLQIVGEQLDLRPVVRELVLLDAPSTPLCRPDCAGLCPTCGVDRNSQACQCEPPPVDPRWSALDALKAAVEPSE